MTDRHINSENSLNCQLCSDKSCASMTLNDCELELMSLNSHESKFRPGDTILSEGSMTSHIIYLKAGLVKEYLKRGRRHEYILQIVKNHSYLGLQSLFGDKINQYSYSALSEVTVCFIDVNLFKRLITENGRFSYEILSVVCKDSLNNYHRFLAQHQKTIAGKLADALFYFSKLIFESNKFLLPLNRNEISYLLGTSRESVSRQLKKFHDEGIIEINANEIVILRPAQLEQISKYG